MIKLLEENIENLCLWDKDFLEMTQKAQTINKTICTLDL